MRIKKVIAYFLMGTFLMNIFQSSVNAQSTNFSIESNNQTEQETIQNTAAQAETDSSFKVQIPKNIVLDGTLKSGTYSVIVTGNISGLETVKVVPDSSLILSSTNLPDVTAQITQDKTSWEYNEIGETISVVGGGLINAENLTAGDWYGNFNFNISLIEDTTIAITAYNKNSNNLNATANAITGTEKKFLLDELAKSGLAENDTVRAIIKINSDNLSELAKITLNVNTITNLGDNVVILHFNELTQEWEYFGTELVDEYGNVTSNFTNYTPVSFIKYENGIPTHIHHHVETIIDPTCTEDGSYDYTCPCGDFYSEPIEKLGHDYISTIIDATCTAEGCTEHICNTCGDTYQDEPKEMLPHTYGEFITTLEPTCTEIGKEERICSICEFVEVKDIEALGHDFETNYTIDVVETCTTEGSKSQHCSRCEEKQNITAIAVLGHDYSITITKEATCTNVGVMQYDCINCYHQYKEVISAKGHKYDLDDYIIDKEATCTTNGHKSVHCEVCDVTISGTIQIIPATGHTDTYGGIAEIHTKCKTCDTITNTTHSYTSATTTEPTCETNGIKTYSCVCGYEYTESIEKLGHSYKLTVTDPTCTEKGYTTHTCSKCNHIFTDTEIAALGHKFDDFTTTSEPNCTTDGSKQRTCSVCEYVDIIPIEKLGHDFATEYTIDKESTCDVEGSKSQHCSRCEEKQNITAIEKLEHTIIDGGIETAHTKCSVCKNVVSTEHIYEKALVSEATCTTNGSNKYTCVCGYTYTTEDIPALSHNYEITETIESTCSLAGNNHYKCIRCNDEYDEAINIKEHIYTANNYITDNAATCATDGSKSIHCDVCNAIIPSTVQVIPAAGHNFDEPVITKDATCIETGSREVQCTKCTYIFANEIPTLGHDFATEYTVDIAETCTTEGSKSQHCSRCEEKQNIISIPATGHIWTNDECSICGAILEAGFYDENGNLIISWDDAVNTYNLNIEQDYTLENINDPGRIGIEIMNFASNTVKIVLPEGIMQIGDYQFYGCNKLIEIVLPNSINSIGINAFNGCNNLVKAIFKNPNDWFVDILTENDDKTALSNADLSNSSTAARFLNNTYITNKLFK